MWIRIFSCEFRFQSCSLVVLSSGMIPFEMGRLDSRLRRDHWCLTRQEKPMLWSASLLISQWIWTYFSFLKEYLCMKSAHSGIIQPNATIWIATESNRFVVDGKRSDDCLWIKTFYKAESTKSAYLRRVHRRTSWSQSWNQNANRRELTRDRVNYWY